MNEKSRKNKHGRAPIPAASLSEGKFSSFNVAAFKWKAREEKRNEKRFMRMTVGSEARWCHAVDLWSQTSICGWLKDWPGCCRRLCAFDGVSGWIFHRLLWRKVRRTPGLRWKPNRLAQKWLSLCTPRCSNEKSKRSRNSCTLPSSASMAVHKINDAIHVQRVTILQVALRRLNFSGKLLAQASTFAR